MTTNHDTADLWRSLQVEEIDGARRLSHGGGRPLTEFQITLMLAVSEEDLAEILRDDDSGILPGSREVLLEGARTMAAALRLLVIRDAISFLDAPERIAECLSDRELATVASWAEGAEGAADGPR